jgi:hypothetical protein
MREVGAIFSLWAKERELLFDEKWLLNEKRFKGTSLGTLGKQPHLEVGRAFPMEAMTAPFAG